MSGKEICTLTKEQFLSRAPPFMGDILWAHLEILQKEVDNTRANIENVPSNYTESFADQQNRTYTQLDSSPNTTQPAPPALMPSTPVAMAIAAQSPQTTTCAAASRYPPVSRPSGMYPGMDYIGSGTGSVVDTNSEYSYHGGMEMKYSHQMAAANGGQRVPPTQGYYPSYQEQYDHDWYDPNAWHQPTSTTADFHPVTSSTSPPVSPPVASTALPSFSAPNASQTSTSTSTSVSTMHQHPAFLQVSFFYDLINSNHATLYCCHCLLHNNGYGTKCLVLFFILIYST